MTFTMNLPSLKVKGLKRAKIYIRKVAKIYRRLYGCGKVRAPYHTNISKIL